MKKRIKILSIATALFSIGVSAIASVALVNSSTLSPKSTTITNTDNTKNDDKSALVPAQANGQNANISTNAGPITFNGNVITALDWYGNKLWSVDMSTKVKGPYNGSWKRAWYNWDYDRTQNILWALGYGYISNQSIYGINANTGEFIKEKSLGYVGNGVNKDQSPFRFITALSSGKVLIYGDPSKDYNGVGLLYDPKNDSLDKLKGNSPTYLPTNDGNPSHKGSYKWYFYNLIPLTNNTNLVEVVAFDKQSGTTGDQSSSRASYNVYGILVDDNLNFIGNNQSSSTFKTAVKLADGVPGFRNTTITPKRDYFTLLNSQTVSVTYNIITLFDTKDPNNIQIKQVKMANPKIIQTWTVDSNDNLYFKFLEDGKVYKIDSSTLKSGNSNFSPTTYLDLSAVSDENVRKDASSFIIYNVYGYTGQLMMIDALYSDAINIYDETTNTNNKPNLGLAIAVTTNKNQNTTGDFKGILNGPNSIQQASDFTIESNILTSKLPSEITKSDIKLLNGAFFKSDDPKPFIISDINDNDGTFKITANLYKIPWFADTLPNNSVPTVVTYKFGNGDTSKPNANKIKNKVSWKELNSSSNYDFMNMLPTNITLTDINNLNPFQASFQSQVIIDGNGDQVYPKTTYQIESQNNSAGTIKIKVNYDYVPMSVNYIGGNDKSYTFGSESIQEKQVLTYTDEKTYTVFKENDNSAFWFTGAEKKSENNGSQTIDASKVPQLKNLLSAGKLPSSFSDLSTSNDSSNSQFLQFVNTSLSKGYPISKMNFTVSPDDTNGTLTITATMPAGYSPDKQSHTYSIMYTNLNKKASYTFKFKDVNSIDGVNINTILPSAVDEGEIIKNFITYENFDSNDFSVILTPNDEQGTLSVQINLNKSYANSIASDNGFTNYSITRLFSGFMTTAQYNSRYSLTFKGDDDTSLLDLKNMQASQVEDLLTNANSKGLTLNGKTYTNLNDFIENVLVQNAGSSIPKNWSSDNNIKSNIYIDNNLGVASFYVNIPKASVQGSSSDLNFMVTYTGFVKGNVNPTEDNLSFVSDKMLKNYLVSKCGMTADEVKNLTPKVFADWASKNIDKLITYKTGQYVDKLKDSTNGYTLTVTPNEIQGTVSITINFGSMKNPLSLSEYTVQYTI